jgi:hypothetical protein
MSDFDIKYYKIKSSAIKHLNEHNILCNKNITNYFILNDYQEFLNLILLSETKDYYEYISSKSPVNLFFDVEIYNQSSIYFDDTNSLIDIIINQITNHLGPSYNIRTT